MLVLIVGSLAIAGLVVWALTRTVEPAVPVTSTFTSPASVPQPGAAESPAATTPVPAAAAPAAPAPAAPAPAAPSAGTNAGVTRVQPPELKELVDRGSVTVVDVRDSVSYTNGHIPGAIHIPFSRIEAESGNLPKGKPIVAYCT